MESGEFFVLLGPSGSGKTVTVETVLGFHTPDSGKVLVSGRDVTGLQLERRNFSYLPQDVSLFPNMSCKDNILYSIRYRKPDPLGDGKKWKQRFNLLVEILEISHLLERRDIATLSGGEKQRVGLARAALPESVLLVMDEPFSFLDEHKRRALEDSLLEMKNTLGTSILAVLHYRDEAFALGDRIGVMIDGRIRQIGNGDDLWYKPADGEIARFLSVDNIFTATVKSNENGTVLLDKNGIELQATGDIDQGETVDLMIRPEEVMIIRPGVPVRPRVSANRLMGRITKIIRRGALHTLYVDSPILGERITIALPNCAYRDMGISKGIEVEFSLKRSALWVLPKRA